MIIYTNAVSDELLKVMANSRITNKVIVDYVVNRIPQWLAKNKANLLPLVVGTPNSKDRCGILRLKWKNAPEYIRQAVMNDEEMWAVSPGSVNYPEVKIILRYLKYLGRTDLGMSLNMQQPEAVLRKAVAWQKLACQKWYVNRVQRGSVVVFEDDERQLVLLTNNAALSSVGEALHNCMRTVFKTGRTTVESLPFQGCYYLGIRNKLYDKWTSLAHFKTITLWSNSKNTPLECEGHKAAFNCDVDIEVDGEKEFLASGLADLEALELIHRVVGAKETDKKIKVIKTSSLNNFQSIPRLLRQRSALISREWLRTYEIGPSLNSHFVELDSFARFASPLFVPDKEDVANEPEQPKVEVKQSVRPDLDLQRRTQARSASKAQVHRSKLLDSFVLKITPPEPKNTFFNW